MSRLGLNYLNGYDVGRVATVDDRGFFPDDAVTSAQVTVRPRSPGVPGARVGDMVILIHIADTASNAGMGQPSRVGNPWTLLVDQGASTSHGGCRVRMWWKFATLDEMVVASTYRVTTASAQRQGLIAHIVPHWGFDPLDGGPRVAVKAGSGGSMARAPRFTMTGPDHPGRHLAAIGGFTVTNTGVNGVITEGPVEWNKAFSGSTVRYGGGSGNSGRTSNVGIHSGWGVTPMTTGTLNRPWDDFVNPTRVGNVAEIKIALLIKPYDYQLPTGTIADDLRDDFSDPARSLDPARVDIGGGGQVAVVDDKLRMTGPAYYDPRVVFDLRGQGVAIDVGAIENLDQSGASFQMFLGVNDDPTKQRFSRWSLVMEASKRGERTVIRVYRYDEGSGQAYTIVGDHSAVTRWWRIREDGGSTLFEVSPDNSSWNTLQVAQSLLLPDQLAAATLRVQVAGSAAVSLGSIAAPTSVVTGTVPTRRTLDWMGVTTSNEERWHARDVLVGIVDQGTTREMRAAKQLTMVRRRYFAGTPAGGAEIESGQIHGCLVTPCAVPYGGRFVEAVCSDAGGGSSAAILSASMRWCAEQGAKVINVSWGGGGLDQVYISTASHIAATYDCEVYIAAGNSARYGIDAPAALSNAFSSFHSVGAFDEKTNARASFSNYHELLSGVAPGEGVAGIGPGGGVLQWRGTSAAAPHAAGLCARILTRGADPQGRRFTAAQAGVALDRSGRDTGQSRTEQGGGAFDLGRALAVIGDSAAIGLLPGVAMPRFRFDQSEGVAASFNRIASAVERLGMHVLVRYKADPTWASLPSGRPGIVPWDHADGASHTGMWDPDHGATISIVEDGFYLIVVQIRFGNLRLDETYATGAPYTAGERVATLLLNGDDPLANTLAVDRKAGTGDGEGATCQLVAQVPLRRGDWLFVQLRQTSGATIECLQPDFGGTWMVCARIAPVAPTLFGEVPPVQSVTATGTRWDRVRLGWTNPGDPSFEGALIRRLVGTAGPQTIADGVHVTFQPAPVAEWVDEPLAGATTYTYSVFARHSGGYAFAASATVTTPTPPPPPDPVTNLRITRPTTGSFRITWSLPSTGPQRGAVMIRRSTPPGDTPPGAPDVGTLVAELPPDATSHTLAGLTPGSQYGLSVWTVGVERVFSAPAQIQRRAAVDVTLFGSIVPGSSGTPGLTSIRTDGPIRVGLYFQVTEPAELKGVRYFKATTAVTASTGRVYASDFDRGIHGPITPVVQFPAGGANTYIEAVFDEFVELVPNRWYKAMVYYSSASYPECTPYWGPGGYGANNLRNGILRAPGNQSFVGNARPAQNSSDRKTNDESAVPLSGSTPEGPNWYPDVIINPI